MGTLAQDIEKMVLDLQMVARNATLDKEPRFAERLEAIAFIETQVIDPSTIEYQADNLLQLFTIFE